MEENSMMDQRIVKLNDFAKVKMEKISSKKRPAAKEARELAKYILANWDSEFELSNIKDEDVHNEEILDILHNRLNNFAEAKKACEKAVKELENSDKEVKLTDKEKSALEFFVKASDGEEGFIMEDVKKLAEEIAGIKPSSIKGISSSLQKKGILEMNNGSAHFDGVVTKLGMETYKGLVSETNTSKNDEKKVTKEPKAPKTSGHKVGDIHKNGKWVWTEYQPGKFDWRTIPSEKKQGKRTDIENKNAKKDNKPSKNITKKSKKGNEKNEEPKMINIEEFRTMPKNANNKKKMSNAQATAFQLIMKGYWVEVKESECAFFVNDKGDRKQCNMDSLKSLFKRYGLDYIPEGLVK